MVELRGAFLETKIVTKIDDGLIAIRGVGPLQQIVHHRYAESASFAGCNKTAPGQ